MPNKTKKEDEFGFVEDPSADLGFQENPQSSTALTPTGLPKIIQDTAQVITTPQRGMRGVGVGMEKILEGVSPTSFLPGVTFNPEDISTRIGENLPSAIERAAAAVQPGYQPQPGEKIGATAGEAIGALPLAAALTPELGPMAIPALAHYALKALAAGAGGSAFAAINDASEKGRIEPVDVITAGGINAIFPIVRPVASKLASFIRASTEIPISGSTSLTREAMGEFRQDPKLLEHAAGTAESIGRKVENIQRQMISQMQKIGNKIKGSRLNFGITSPLETPIEQVSIEGIEQKGFKDIVKDFTDLKRGYKVEPAGVDSVTGAPIREKKILLSPKDRMRQLYDLRFQIDQNNVIKEKAGATVQAIAPQDVETNYLKGLRGKVNVLLDELSPQVKGGSLLRLMDSAYSKSRELYDRFLKKLADPGQAEQTLMGIYRKGNPDEIIGLDSNAVDVLRRLERKTGEKYIEPLRKEFASREFRKIVGRGGSTALSLFGLPGAMLESAGTSGISNILNFMTGSASVINRIQQIALSKGTQRAALAATSSLQNQGEPQ